MRNHFLPGDLSLHIFIERDLDKVLRGDRSTRTSAILNTDTRQFGLTRR